MNLKYIDYFTQEENVSLNRLKQMLYLADWFNCLRNDTKLTNFEYKFEYNLIDAKGIYKLLSYVLYCFIIFVCKVLTIN